MWKIAIIDDDRQVLKGMKQVIPWKEIGAEWAGESTNGAKGLELIRQTKPDIVITDVYMPVMDGLKMIEQLREERYGGKFLIHSGYSDFEFARKALRLNVEDYLSKPVSRHTLREALQRVIQAVEQENRLRKEQNELKEKVGLYEPLAHKEWLKTAVTGSMDHWNKEHPLFSSGIDRSHLVLGIEIMRTTRIAEVGTSDRFLFRFAIQNIIQEILGEENLSFDFVELHGYHAALIIHVDQDATYEELKDGITAIAGRIIECVQKYLYVSLRIGIGGLKKHWSKLSDSLEEAFHFLTQEASVIPASSLYEYHDSGKRSHKQAVDFMKQYIHENYTREITLAELADKVFISRNYLSLIFKNATGETINNYIIRVRMEKAKSLLLMGTLKIYEIAESVGYKNIPYFSTTFKKHFGVTPAELSR
ncbi:response regulator [Paenibacillus sepulcri]|uniref:Response regulator n=1 Tax=Paenibacillus sepulcri TaxID=359917 RepID=A0ABS7BXF8_9BACL|nr:response regulator [Paenibacillus sepulcri]